MTALELLLPVAWALVIGGAVALYVVLDGFDLGIGILFPFFRAERDRDQMMTTVAPFWDGNETWLVLGGVGLWVAFPVAFGVIMPALYLPVIVLLLALVFRGVAFEFRWVAKPRHRKWDIAFAGGSTLAAFAQGLVLGGLLQGIEVRNGEFAGATLDWLTPFSLVTGCGLVVGYALLGATWLAMTTEGGVAARARRLGRGLLAAFLAAIVAVSVWTPLAIPRIADRWFRLPEFLWLAPLPLATLALAIVCWRGLRHGRRRTPFVAAVLMFLLAYVGLLVSNVPYLVPPALDVWQSAGDAKSLAFALVGTLVLLPVILGYTVFNYWLFRGRTRAGERYH